MGYYAPTRPPGDGKTVVLMLRKLLFRLNLLFVMVVMTVAAGLSAAGATTVTGVRLGQNGDFTRLVLDLDDASSFRTFLLDGPPRVVVDFPPMDWRLLKTAGRQGRGVIAGFRFGVFDRGTSRMVLDLKRPARVAQAFILPPREGYGYRFVIDLKPVGQKEFSAILRPSREGMPAAMAATRPAAIRLPPVPVARPRQRLPVVVLDPGHGGIDPGASSLNGHREKDITLAIARNLARHLRATGRVKVVMTRNRDIFLKLRERVRIARRAGADLFISLHADTISRSSVRGASIYTLSETASDKEAAALAAKENKADVIAGVNLSGHSEDVAEILIDLAQREAMNASASFVSYLLPAMRRHGIKLLRKPHRSAGFRVLKAPDVASVLLELGYLSNRRDESRLLSRKGQSEIAAAITDAVLAYLEKQQAYNR